MAELIAELGKLLSGEAADVGLIVSKALGFAIILASFFLKVPQIVKIAKAQSVAGLSTASLYLEVVLYLASLVYNVLQGYPFSTWGEVVIIFAQTVIILSMYWSYKGASFGTISGALAALSGLAALIVALPAEYRWIVPLCQIPVGMAARIPQIIANFSNGHTGQLSLITFTMNFFGSLVRAFTTFKEVKDPVMLFGYSVAVTLNAILVLQILLFWSATNKATAAAAAKKTK